MTTLAPSPALFIERDVAEDYLCAIECGRVVDGVPEELLVEVNHHVAWIYDELGGRPVGFFVRFAGEIPDTGARDWAPLWDSDGPRFDAPSLALRGALTGEIIIAGLARFGGESTLNRVFFIQALGAPDEDALKLWKLCLECGDLSAHYALGYTHYELGNYAEAYSHLSYYAPLAPADPWVWAWLGRAAVPAGHRDEAITALQLAVKLDPEDETDAGELLRDLLDGWD